MYNRLLERQLRRHLPAGEPVPEYLGAFIAAVSESYDRFEADRRMIERMMDLSSAELMEANERLRSETERQRAILFELQGAMAASGVASAVSEMLEGREDDLLVVAQALREIVDLRNDAERRLSESEERFRAIAEQSSDLIVRYDRDGHCTYIS